jgi:predicted ATPase
MRDDLPSGTVTFLFTDVEGSTKLLHELGAEAYADALAEHRRVIREACAAEGGVEVDTQGDAFFVAFPTAPGAVAAASVFTEELASGSIQVRVGVHTGTPLSTEEGYVGGDVHRAARIAAAGHAGQVLVSASTALLVDVDLHDLGEHRFKDLAASERVYQLGEGDFPPLASLYRTNLPIPATPFLGRKQELSEVAELLDRDDVRLLTLTGPGGTGKTRLAIQAVAEASDRYPDGVWWVPLAPLSDPRLVPQTAAHVLGVKNGLAAHITDKRMLVLFDNFEQVVEAGPGLADVVAECPNLDVLVTSRERLRVQGEQNYSVPPLAESDGERLFTARARAVEPSFTPNETVGELCRRLDELPLALELAAARTALFSPEELLERLSQRLDLLKGLRDADPRHRTLRATIAWSYDLLSELEQALFCSLAVFVGGCDFEAAEEIAGADPDTLQSLIDKSLLRKRQPELGARYWMLETIREYARERLDASGIAESLRSRHARHYFELAGLAEPELVTSEQAAWLHRLDAENDNLRAALDWWLKTQEWETGLRMAVWLRRFWEVRGHFREARLYLSRLTDVDQPPELRALALRDLVYFTLELDELDETQRYAEERLRLCRDLGDLDGANRALQNLGVVAERQGDLDRAKALYGEVLARARELSVEVSVPLMNLANVAWKQGEFAQAEALYEEALADVESMGDDVVVAFASRCIAGVRLYQGRPDMARPPLRRALLLYEQLRSPSGLADAFEIAANLSADSWRAGQLLGKADDLRVTIGERRPHIPLGPYEQAVAAAVDVLGQERFEIAHAEGRALSIDEALASALASID